MNLKRMVAVTTKAERQIIVWTAVCSIGALWEAWQFHVAWSVGLLLSATFGTFAVRRSLRKPRSYIVDGVLTNITYTNTGKGYRG